MAVDAALREAYCRSFRFDALGDEGAVQGQEDPTFIGTSRASSPSLAAVDSVERRYVCRSWGVMANIIPQFGSLWPSLTSITGTDCQTKEGKATA